MLCPRRHWKDGLGRRLRGHLPLPMATSVREGGKMRPKRRAIPCWEPADTQQKGLNCTGSDRSKPGVGNLTILHSQSVSWAVWLCCRLARAPWDPSGWSGCPSSLGFEFGGSSRRSPRKAEGSFPLAKQHIAQNTVPKRASCLARIAAPPAVTEGERMAQPRAHWETCNTAAHPCLGRDTQLQEASRDCAGWS